MNLNMDNGQFDPFSRKMFGKGAAQNTFETRNKKNERNYYYFYNFSSGLLFSIFLIFQAPFS